jgi:hypothetical protein
MILKGKKQGKAKDHLFPPYPSNPVKTSPSFSIFKQRSSSSGFAKQMWFLA